MIAGDNLFTFSLKLVMKRYRELEAPLIAIYDVGSPELAKNYGVIEVDSDMRIISFEEKPRDRKGSLVSTGIYVYPRETILMMPRYFEEAAERTGLETSSNGCISRFPFTDILLMANWGI